jgi:hypothetical protein
MIPAIIIVGDGTVTTTARLRSVNDPGGIAVTAGAFSNQVKNFFIRVADTREKKILSFFEWADIGRGSNFYLAFRNKINK